MTSTRIDYRALIGVLFLPNFVISILIGVAEPVLPLYIQSTGASYAIVGIVLSALAIGRLLATLPGSGILTRYSMRHTMLAGCAVMTAALLAMAAANSLPIIFASWLLTGMGLTLYEIARHQYVAAHIVNHNRGRIVAIIGGTFRLGIVVGPVMGGWLAREAGFQAPFLLMAGLAALTGFIIYLYMPHQASPRQTQPFSMQAYAGELRQTFREQRRVLLAAGGGQLLMQLVRRSRSVIIPLYAANVIGLDVAAVGVVISVGSVLDTMMFAPAGMILDRYGRKAAIIPSLLIQATGLLLLPLTASFAALVAVAGLMGFGNGISSGTMITLGADLAPPDRRAPFLGLWRVTNSLGFALGPNVVGAVAGMMGLSASSMVAGLIGLSAAALFYRFVPETLQRE